MVLFTAFFLPLVVEFAPFAQADGEFDPTAFEVNIQRDQGEPFGVELTPELVDLAAMGQQPAHPQRLMVEVAAGLFMAGNVHVVQLQLALADQAEAITQVGLAGADGFHLSSQQLNAGFQGFHDFVLVPGLPVVSQQLLRLEALFGCRFCPFALAGHALALFISC